MKTLSDSIEAVLAQPFSIEKIDQLNEFSHRMVISDITSALQLAEKVRKLIAEFATPYQKGFIDSGLIFAWENYYMGSISIADEVAHQALAWYESRDERVGIMRALYLSGVIYRRVGSFDRSVETHLKQLDIAKQLRDTESQAEALNVLGVISVSLKDWQQAEAYYTRSQQLYRDTGSIRGEANVLVNKAYYQLMLENYTVAADLALEARELIDQHDSSNTLLKGMSYYCLGRIYSGLEMYEQSLLYCFEALKLLKAVKLEHNIGITYMFIGECYAKQKRYDDAIAYFHQAIEALSQFMNRVPLTRCYQGLATVYEEQGDLAQALLHFKKFQEVQEVSMEHEAQMRLRHYELVTSYEQTKLENKLLEQQQEEDRQYFERLTEMKNEFIGTASHDLKNPLASIILSVDMLNRRPDADAEFIQKRLMRIKTAASRMKILIADLLDIAKLETGRALNIEPVLVADFIKNSIAVSQSLAEAKQIQFTIEQDIPITTVSFDALRLQQVLENLLSNAIKYTPVGGQVRLYVEYFDETLLFHVSDTGIGIPAQDIPHLFERFYRVDEEGHQAEEGTGLGLSIVKMIVEQHGGNIRVASTVGQGTTFSFSLPNKAKSTESPPAINELSA